MKTGVSCSQHFIPALMLAHVGLGSPNNFMYALSSGSLMKSVAATAAWLMSGTGLYNGTLVCNVALVAGFAWTRGSR